MALYERLKETMETIARPCECVLVDDGSTDESLSILQQIASVDSRFTVVALHQNSGKSIALSAGFNVARGHFIITLDGDLQHDPADIPRFIEKLEEGYDIVGGCRATRMEPSGLQRFSNRCANWVLRSITGVDLRDWGSGFKAYKRSLVSDLPIYGELQRLIPALALRKGTKVCEIPIEIAARKHGVSNYGILRKLPVFFDLLTVRFLQRYLSRPLHFFGTAGVLVLTIGCAIGFWLLMSRLAYGTQIMAQHGPMLIFAAVLIVCGIQLMALGLLGEMQVRHHFESRRGSFPRDAADIIRASNQVQAGVTNPPSGRG